MQYKSFDVENFNPHSYARSDYIGTVALVLCVNFNPLLREERRKYIKGGFNMAIISIHTPTRGATFN
mgnify:CR=1 FL=1